MTFINGGTQIFFNNKVCFKFSRLTTWNCHKNIFSNPLESRRVALAADLKAIVPFETDYTVSGGDDYDLLLFVANWPGKRIDAWSSLLKARAIENQCYVAAVNRVGKDGNDFECPGASVVHDPLGETLLKLGPEEETATTEISLSQVKSVREQLPFYREAEHFELRQ